MAIKVDNTAIVNAWFVSDIHIQDINERSSIKLLRFLSSLESGERPVSHLFLLGDIFDLWVSNASVFVQKYQAFVDAIKRLRDKGVQVIYFEGNHDVHVKQFWQDQLQIPTYVDHQSFQLGSITVRAEHGDLINPLDHKYLKYRSLIRKPFMEKIAPAVSGQALERVGRWASRQSRKYSQVQRQIDYENLRTMIRLYAKSQSQSDHFDLLVTGHMHVQDVFSFENNGHKVTSINLGSWFDGAKALHLTDQGPQFVSLD